MVVHSKPLKVKKTAVVNQFDEQPIGGQKNTGQLNPDEFEDKPLPKGAYNLDALGADAFGGG